VAALLFAAGVKDSDDKGDNIADDVRDILNDTAEDLGDDGWDHYFGHGLVDTEAAVAAVGSGDPTVEITYPTDGSIISGSITITATANDDDGSVDKVEFYYGTSLIGTDVSDVGGWSCDWSTTSLSDDSYVIKAIATDNEGNTDSDSITVTTENTDDAPTISWVNPEDGNTLTGTVTIQIDANDDRDVTGTLSVELQIDGGTPITAAYNSATDYYEYTLDTKGVNEGDHILDARATDSGSNTGNEVTITVTVRNSVGCMYVWDISWGTAGPHLKGTITILYDSDNDGISESSDNSIIGASVEFNVKVDTDDDGDYDDDEMKFSGTTDSSGQMSFLWKQATSGKYEGEVTSLSHTSYDWNSDIDVDNPDHYG
jgi:hypothetical protein